jgi:cytochrome P450
MTSFCRDQIANSVLTLLFAGHDTSSTTLTRIFQHLHANPEAAARLRQEQVGFGCPAGAAAAFS